MTFPKRPSQTSSIHQTSTDLARPTPASGAISRFSVIFGAAASLVGRRKVAGFAREARPKQSQRRYSNADRQQ